MPGIPPSAFPVVFADTPLHRNTHRHLMLDDIKKTLWATADTLRANMDAAEYKHLVLGLIFVKYLSDTEAGSNGSSTKLLSTLRDTVLPRLISDQLRLLVAAMLLAAMGRI